MKTIDELKQDYKKHPNHYQPLFLLSYGHYLKRSELIDIDMDSVLDGLSDNDIEEFDKNVIKFNEKNVIKSLAVSLKRAFDYALNKDKTNAALYFNEIKAWCFILDNKDLYNFKVYNYYGLPLFKAVAEYYKLNNQIGDNTGKEKYYE